jgi:hypothetical protein
MLFGIGLFAGDTAKALQPVPMLAKATAFNLAVKADHRSTCFGLLHHTIIIQEGLAVLQ